ncbi:MAG TPA: double zinc ribbon domain-containing protein, partial [Thermoanaerobaculia bacterium]
MTAPLYAPGPAGVTPPALPPPRTLADRVLFLLLPATCLGCGQPLPARAPLSLCAPCRSRLAPLPAATCAVCARPLAGAGLPAGYLCGRCRERPPAFDRLLALWLYAPPLEAVVRGLKFARLDYLGPQLGKALAEGLGDRLQGGDVVVPVPLHWWRRWGRGYNQAERIAAPLARDLGLPLSSA